MRKLTALKSFSYGRPKRALWPGDDFEAVSDRDAKWLIGARRAKVREEPAPAALDVPAQPAAEPVRRKYKRRDMEAEESTPSVVTVPSRVPPLADGGDVAPAEPATDGTTMSEAKPE